MNNIRTIEEYKEDVFDKLDEQQKLEWLYEMSMQINRAIEKLETLLPICIMPNNMLIHGIEKAKVIEETINILKDSDKE